MTAAAGTSSSPLAQVPQPSSTCSKATDTANSSSPSEQPAAERALLPGQPCPGGGELGAADGGEQAEAAAGEQQQQGGQGLLGGVMSQRCHDQRGWQ
jgi:hypothetical protein